MDYKKLNEELKKFLEDTKQSNIYVVHFTVRSGFYRPNYNYIFRTREEAHEYYEQCYQEAFKQHKGIGPEDIERLSVPYSEKELDAYWNNPKNKCSYFWTEDGEADLGTKADVTSKHTFGVFDWKWLG